MLTVFQLSEDDFLIRLVLEGEGYITPEHSRAVMERLTTMARMGRPTTYAELVLALGHVVPADLSYAQYLLKQLRASGHNGRRPLGYFILEQGFARPTQLLEALEWQTQLGGRIGEIMIQNGWLTDEQVSTCLTLQQTEPAPLSA